MGTDTHALAVDTANGNPYAKGNAGPAVIECSHGFEQ
jgi:hypothetical protein